VSFATFLVALAWAQTVQDTDCAMRNWHNVLAIRVGLVWVVISLIALAPLIASIVANAAMLSILPCVWTVLALGWVLTAIRLVCMVCKILPTLAFATVTLDGWVQVAILSALSTVYTTPPSDYVFATTPWATGAMFAMCPVVRVMVTGMMLAVCLKDNLAVAMAIATLQMLRALASLVGVDLAVRRQIAQVIQTA